jgi:hypothetical protein
VVLTTPAAPLLPRLAPGRPGGTTASGGTGNPPGGADQWARCGCEPGRSSAGGCGPVCCLRCLSAWPAGWCWPPWPGRGAPTRRYRVSSLPAERSTPRCLCSRNRPSTWSRRRARWRPSRRCGGSTGPPPRSSCWAPTPPTRRARRIRSAWSRPSPAGAWCSAGRSWWPADSPPRTVPRRWPSTRSWRRAGTSRSAPAIGSGPTPSSSWRRCWPGGSGHRKGQPSTCRSPGSCATPRTWSRPWSTRTTSWATRRSCT